MPEDNRAGELGEASTGQVAESSTTALPESAATEPEATPTTEESTTTDVVDAASVWDSPLDFSAIATDEDGKTSTTADKPAEKGEATDNTSDTTDTEAETDAETDADATESDDTDTEPEVSETDAVQDADKPAPLSRRKREAAVKSIIEPFRDEKVPPQQVFDALYELNPTRAQALAAEIAESSAQAYPDLWLSTILGEEVTVEDVKQRLQAVQSGEAATGITSANSTTQTVPSDTQSAADYQEVVNHLTDLYGEDWKDPNKDDDLFTEDRLYVDMVRKHLAGQNVSAEKQSEKDAEIARLKQELDSLKPEIENIKTAQQQEIELKIEEAYTTAAREYQSSLENRSLERFFEQAGLKDSPDDSDAVKQAKAFVRSRYDRERSGDFDNYVMTKFGEREALMKMVERVDKNLKLAADADVRASKTANRAEAEKLRTAAESARRDAKAEQDRLTVLHRKASQEFLKSELGFVNDLLEQIADRDRRLAQQGRAEVIGAAATGNGNSLVEKIKNSPNPWEVDAFAEAFADAGR